MPVVHVESVKIDNTIALYEVSSSNPTPQPPPGYGTFQDWGQGPAITQPEWSGGHERYRACLRRNASVAVHVVLAVTPTPTAALSGTLEGRVTVDGDRQRFSAPATASFSFSAGARQATVALSFNGHLPDDVGRYALAFDWSCASPSGFTFRPETTTIRVYTIFDGPIDPAFDSNDPAETGNGHRRPQDTISGTQKRMDHLMRLLDSRHLRHSVATPAEQNQLLWKVHVGINNATPPYFDAGHAQSISHNGRSSDDQDDPGTEYPVQHQWLMWARAPTRPHWAEDRRAYERWASGPRTTPQPRVVTVHDKYWNDGSCIGHVQLLKTMVATLGMFARRAWIFPTTTLMPIHGSPHSAWRGHSLSLGATVSFPDEHIYSLGNFRSSDIQTWRFPDPVDPHGPQIIASPKLMEPEELGYENFEACLKTPNGRFLPGGYSVSSITSAAHTPESRRIAGDFAQNGGFASAADVLRWWSGTTRPGFVRFMLWAGVRFWVENGRRYGESVYWNKLGDPVTRAQFATVRTQNLHLPAP
ncbi:MAG: hypothetical protein U0271_11165 [Polyangiaceae bacterium]